MPKKLRVWGYKDGTLLMDGFESVDQPGAEIPCLVALLESLGVEVCIGSIDDSNSDVATWTDVSET